jgi:hypothetical protein
MKINVLKTVLLFAMSTVAMHGQKKEKEKEKIRLPFEVKIAFERQHPNVNPKWTEEYRGLDNDELIYEAKFKINNKSAYVVYDKSGNLKAEQESLDIYELPKNAINYLKTNFPRNTMNNALKITKGDNKTTYQVGVVKEQKYYNTIFDNKGNFIDLVEKS